MLILFFYVNFLYVYLCEEDMVVKCMRYEDIWLEDEIGIREGIWLKIRINKEG